jgi:uncharacterized lipoprotein NlpE involved in copper resistance
MAAVAAGALAGPPAEAAKMVKRDDAALSAMLVGIWVNPPDSADYEGIPSAEVFNADGTYSYIEYEDAACQKVSGAVHSKWYVWDGTIVNEVGDGKTLKDEIVNMAAKKMVLRSLDDSLTYHRIRATTKVCAGTLPSTKAGPSASR